MTAITEITMPWHTTIERAAPMAGTDAELALNASEDTDIETTDGFKPFGDDGFTFLDVIDMINPLQHIPIIGPLYREMTDDTLDPVSRVVGGTLYFGPIGAAVAATNVAVEESTGKDVGGHVLAFIQGDDEQAPDTEIANTIEDDSKTLTVTSTVLPSAGTDGEDMVTAWARAELAYRAQLTESQGTPRAVKKAETAIPRHDAVVATASQIPMAMSKSSGDQDISVDQWLAAYSAASKQHTAAQNLLKAPPPSSGQANTKVAAAAYQHTTGQAPSSETENAGAGSVASDGGWFSAAMFDALARYDVREEIVGAAPGKKVNLVN